MASARSGLTFTEDATHFREMYGATVRDLAGSPFRTVMPALVSRESIQGETAWFDAIGPGDAATVTSIEATKTRKRYAKVAAPTTSASAPGSGYVQSDADAVFDDLASLRTNYNAFRALQTPHMDVAKQRTMCLPSLIEWGHGFDRETKLMELLDPTSKTLRQGMRSIWYQQDKMILDALAAPHMHRQASDGSGTAEVTFANGGGLAVTVSLAATTGVNTGMLAAITQAFEDVYITNEKITLVVSPYIKGKLLANSGTQITSTDFVDSVRYFATGELPDIYGVRVLAHPYLNVSTPATTVEYGYAFVESGVVFNEFDPMESFIDRIASQRFNFQAYVKQFAGCVRTDDRCVCKVTFNKT